MVACVACIVSICSDSACSFSASSPPSRTLIILAESDTKATVTPKTARHSRYSQHNKPASHCIKLVMRPWTRVSTTIIPAARSRIHLQVTSARRLMVVSKMTNPIPCPLLKCCAYSISLKTLDKHLYHDYFLENYSAQSISFLAKRHQPPPCTIEYKKPLRLSAKNAIIIGYLFFFF